MERLRSLSALELNSDATDDDIKKAYKKLALQFHPDKNENPDATARFQEVSQAYQFLTQGPTHGEQYFDPFEVFMRMFGMMSFFDRRESMFMGSSWNSWGYDFYSSDEDDYMYVYEDTRTCNNDNSQPTLTAQEAKKAKKRLKKKQSKARRKVQNTFAGAPVSQSNEHQYSADIQYKTSTVNDTQGDKGPEDNRKAQKDCGDNPAVSKMSTPEKKMSKKQQLSEQRRRDKEADQLREELEKINKGKAAKEKQRQEERMAREIKRAEEEEKERKRQEEIEEKIALEKQRVKEQQILKEKKIQEEKFRKEKIRREKQKEKEKQKQKDLQKEREERHLREEIKRAESLCHLEELQFQQSRLRAEVRAKETKQSFHLSGQHVFNGNNTISSPHEERFVGQQMIFTNSSAYSNGQQVSEKAKCKESNPVRLTGSSHGTSKYLYKSSPTSGHIHEAVQMSQNRHIEKLMTSPTRPKTEGVYISPHKRDTGKCSYESTPKIEKAHNVQLSTLPKLFTSTQDNPYLDDWAVEDWKPPSGPPNPPLDWSKIIQDKNISNMTEKKETKTPLKPLTQAKMSSNGEVSMHDDRNKTCATTTAGLQDDIPQLIPPNLSDNSFKEGVSNFSLMAESQDDIDMNDIDDLNLVEHADNRSFQHEPLELGARPKTCLWHSDRKEPEAESASRLESIWGDINLPETNTSTNQSDVNVQASLENRTHPQLFLKSGFINHKNEPSLSPTKSESTIPMANSYFGQSQTTIPMTNSYFGQSQTTIPMTNSYVGQSQTTIPMTNSYVGQSQTTIPMTNSYVGQSQSTIPMTNSYVGQSKTALHGSSSFGNQSQSPLHGHNLYINQSSRQVPISSRQQQQPPSTYHRIGHNSNRAWPNQLQPTVLYQPPIHTTFLRYPSNSLFIQPLQTPVIQPVHMQRQPHSPNTNPPKTPAYHRV